MKTKKTELIVIEDDDSDLKTKGSLGISFIEI